jgi:hypothetical protein
MTRRVAVLHHREWAVKEGDEKVAREMGGIDNFAIYRRKFAFLAPSGTLLARIRARLGYYIGRILFLGVGDDALPTARRLGLDRRDYFNLGGGRFMSIFDPLLHIGRPIHLAQAIPPSLLNAPDNPYGPAAAAATTVCLEN